MPAPPTAIRVRCIGLWKGCAPRRFSFRGAALRWAAVLLYAFAVIGIPVPSFAEAPAKDVSIPFPCQDRPCGCRDARTCWTGCCCFTLEERRAWAARNGVAVPEFAQESKESAGALGKSCCADTECPLPAKQVAAPKPPSCCSVDKEHACDDQSTPQARPQQVRPPAPLGVKFVIGSLLLRCQGKSPLGVAQLAALPAAEVEGRMPEAPPRAASGFAECLYAAVAAAPDPPPPRG